MELKTGYRVCDAMTRKPIAVEPSTTVLAAAKLMREKDVGSLVIKEGDVLKGYLTEQNIIHSIVAGGKNADKVRVMDIMLTKVPTISPNQDIYDALVVMRDMNTRQLPVLDGEKLVGLLTLKDALKIQPQLFELLVERIKLREEASKPIFGKDILEGTCDNCGEFFVNLREANGEFLCHQCSRK